MISRALHGIRAVVFDTDGVITDSAHVHAEAWKAAFDAHLRRDPPEDPAQRRPFDTGGDYLTYVDGKSRLDGAAAFLASRGLPTDPRTVAAVAADKELRYVHAAAGRRHRRIPGHGPAAAGAAGGGGPPRRSFGLTSRAGAPHTRRLS